MGSHYSRENASSFRNPLSSGIFYDFSLFISSEFTSLFQCGLVSG